MPALEIAEDERNGVIIGTCLPVRVHGQSHPKPPQSHIVGIYSAYTPEYRATSQPPQSHPQATLKPPSSHTKATPKPHQSLGKTPTEMPALPEVRWSAFS